jgi:hypothetical protein
LATRGWSAMSAMCDVPIENAKERTAVTRRPPRFRQR